jgi:hypothetical protein
MASLGALAAQQARFDTTKPGQRRSEGNYSAARQYALTPGQQKMFIGKLEALAAALTSAPVFESPRGFDLTIATRFGKDCSGCARKPAIGAMTLLIAAFENGRTLPVDEGDVAAWVDVNDPSKTLFDEHPFRLGYSLNLKDAAGREIRAAPLETGEFAGVSLFENSRLILSKGSRPYWLPVTREYYLQAVIKQCSETREQQERETAKQYKDWIAAAPERKKSRDELYELFKKTDSAKAEMFVRESLKNDAEMEARLKSAVEDQRKYFDPLLSAYRSELAALSPQERVSPAWKGGQGAEGVRSELNRAHAPGARQLITLNTDFLDPARRGDIQLVTIQLVWNPARFRPDNLNTIPVEKDLPNARLAEFVRTTDWRKVAALLE